VFVLDHLTLLSTLSPEARGVKLRRPWRVPRESSPFPPELRLRLRVQLAVRCLLPARRLNGVGDRPEWRWLARHVAHASGRAL